MYRFKRTAIVDFQGPFVILFPSGEYAGMLKVYITQEGSKHDC
jgi:hypothetical protein